MKIQMNKNRIRTFVAYPILLWLLVICISCNDKEKYDSLLIIDRPKSSDYKECTPYFRTVLLPDRKVTTTILGKGKLAYNEQVIVEGKNLIAFYYYNNNKDGDCGIIDGWYNFAVYFEFVGFKPKLEEEYILPHKNINIYTSSGSAWGGESTFNPKQTSGIIKFHDFSGKRINVSLLLHDSSRTKYPFINAKNLKFKSFKETFYTENEIEPFTFYKQTPKIENSEYLKRFPRI